MEIREATEIDIPKIVLVLKASLGEDQLKLSEEVWKFKHTNNPLGKSIVLVAVKNEKIVGVRALMRWQWQQGSKRFSALRAVDTATHPEHQGKGIFKKLTLKAVDVAKSSNDNFIFNTPNEQSRPGYLKMGWEQVGNIYVGIKPSLSFLKPQKIDQVYNVEKKISQFQLEGLCQTWNKKLESKPGLFTPKSADMLKWRYEDNPLQSYEVVSDIGFYLAAYVKNRGWLKELRIADFLYDENIVKKKNLQEIIDKVVTKFSCHLISFSPNLIQLSGIKGNLGPILTLNVLNLKKEEKEDFLKVYNWNNSLGDLELF
ncbi:Acetyltransferase (GNAT) domain-containing protein [Salinimicrobium sediminis]|uniref:Acetyltransferase (GNAT) domain-containing protein n=1 Tax=Salinimicrobium sediminis TaxID=1343891 RepID=A0A285X4R3_9FLAO|nr:GNAT family N-acetyltransferase [Salinimicrobium sediminis]SOC80321.1 Acetyltransferase (GNAT) domain-containing protein [Salinimicrobium sediminis]